MDRLGHSATSLDELKQIQSGARASQSLTQLRSYFERVQELRRIHAGNFDVQLIVAEAQEEIIQRARDLRSRPGAQPADGVLFPAPADTSLRPRSASAELTPEEETSDEHGPLDRKTWRRATYLALVLLAVVCVAFFYLIQMARRINFSPPPAASSPSQAGNAPGIASSKTPVTNTNAGEPPVSTAPTVRLYTDLIPGTVSVDDGEPQDLKDGELILDHLEPGRHSIKVAGRSGNAAFSFDVSDKSAPQVVPPLAANNAMAVLISAQDGKGRILTSLSQPDVSIDGKSVGQASAADGLALDNLGNTDHELQVAQANDHQRFVMTYTPAPVLTVYVKSDANAGTVTVNTQQDDTSVFVGDRLYRRKTDHGQVRLLLKVGSYTIRVHKDGFVDPPPQNVDVVKGQEGELSFDLVPVPNLASLEVQGAAPGTTVLVDQSQVAIADAAGAATVKNVKEGEHTVELRQEGFTAKKFERDFAGGSIVALAAPDTTLQKTPPDKTADQVAAKEAAAEAKSAPPAQAADLPGEQIRHGGGFVHYNSPKATGRYSFTAHSKIGGFLKHDKLQWYAGYQNSENYIMFSLDGKHASLREMRDGKSYEVNRIPFIVASGEWVQVNMSVKPGSITASVKSPDAGWSEIGTASSTGRDFTQDKVGFYVPGNDEVAVANFHFAQ